MFIRISNTQERLFRESVASFSTVISTPIYVADLPKSCVQGAAFTPMRKNLRWLQGFCANFDLVPEKKASLIVLRKAYGSPYSVPPVSWLEYLDISEQFLKSFERVRGKSGVSHLKTEIMAGISPQAYKQLSGPGIPLNQLPSRSRNVGLHLFTHALTSLRSSDFRRISDFAGESPALTVVNGNLVLKNSRATAFIGKYKESRETLAYTDSAIRDYCERYNVSASSVVAGKPIFVFGNPPKSNLGLGLRYLYNIRAKRVNTQEMFDSYRSPQPATVEQHMVFLQQVLPATLTDFYRAKSDNLIPMAKGMEVVELGQPVLSNRLRDNRKKSIEMEALSPFEQSLCGFMLCQYALSSINNVAQKVNGVTLDDVVLSFVDRGTMSTIRLDIEKDGTRKEFYALSGRIR
ncbi:MAG: hypothetical protein QM758_20785 [Armatimonas sp.]